MTHRCRVFAGPQKWASFKDHLELWDTTESPHERSGGSMPDGEPLATITGRDFKVVRAEVDQFEKENGLVHGCDWEVRGLV